MNLVHDIFNNIIEHLKPKYISKTSVKETALIVKKISSVNTIMYQSLSNTRKNYSQLYKLICKYQTYEYGYVHYYPPYLIDILASNIQLPCCMYSIHNTENTMKDIKKLLRHVSLKELLRCKEGTLRCRSHLNAFAIACINEKIGLDAIEFLLVNMKGDKELLDISLEYYIGSIKINLFDDMNEQNIFIDDRSDDIKALIEKYFAGYFDKKIE